MIAVVSGARRWRRPRRLLHLALLGLAPLGCGDDPTASTPGCDQAPRLGSGDPVMGQLSDADATRVGVPIDYYAVLPDDSTLLIVRMSASDFDPFLYLLREGGEPIAQAFDATGGPGMTIIELRHAVGAGCYLVGASGWARDSRGDYILTAVAVPAD